MNPKWKIQFFGYFLAIFWRNGWNFKRATPSGYGLDFNTIGCRIDKLNQRNESQIEDRSYWPFLAIFWLFLEKWLVFWKRYPLKIRTLFLQNWGQKHHTSSKKFSVLGTIDKIWLFWLLLGEMSEIRNVYIKDSVS